MEEEVRALRTRLGAEEAASRDLLQRLETTQQLLQERETAHTEQVPSVPRPSGALPEALESEYRVFKKPVGVRQSLQRCVCVCVAEGAAGRAV